MGGAEGIVFAFLAAGESGDATALAKRVHAVPPAGQNFVRITLMADIPDQPVPRRVENVVDGNRQFDDAQGRAQVAAGYGNRAHRIVAEFLRELLELFN